MTPPARRGRSPFRRRTSRTALVAAIACCLCATALPTSAYADDDNTLMPNGFAEQRDLGKPKPRAEYAKPDAGFKAITPTAGAKLLSEKLGDSDARLFQRAEARGDDTVTVLLAATPGDIDQVAATVTKAGGSVGRTEEDLGYVRATVPVDAVRDLAALRDVQAIDLSRSYRIPNPQPATGGAVQSVAAPGAKTPADNPYLPVGEIGATDFINDHRTWDGRGITVGVLDTGVDLDHPALRTTTDGKPKVRGWFTATDPLLDDDGSWLQMDREVTGPAFWTSGADWTAPEGSFLFAWFYEANTLGSEFEGDVNRDGDTEDRMAVLYDPADHRIWVDSDQDFDFTDEPVMAGDGVEPKVAHFGDDDPATAISERVPFVAESREDVDLSPLGPWAEGTFADFVNIGIVSASHGTHVAGIIAGNKLFGGKMQGAAPGAQIVSARACTFTGGCTNTALVEGMIDLVTEYDVDVVNMSIGGLPALNDGSDATSLLYDELIEQAGVQIFVSAGNSGPGLNTVGSPSVAKNVVSVAASVSKQTWWADYGSRVEAAQGIFGFSSRGPSENGGLKPALAAPGAAVSTTPTWLHGVPVPETGYALPPGYSMFNGTSMASPQVAGAAALLLSALKATGRDAPAPALRTTLTSSADLIAGVPTTAQGAGIVDTEGAWKLLDHGVASVAYDVVAPVCSPLSHALATPHHGTGIYNRCLPDQGGQRPNVAKAYPVSVTPLNGSTRSREHKLSWLGNDGTFSAPSQVSLRRGVAGTIRITARPDSQGEHSAILKVDDPSTTGIDQLVPVTVIATEVAPQPDRKVVRSGSVDRAGSESVFVAVPADVRNLELALTEVGASNQVRFLAIDPYGVPVDPQASNRCYTNHTESGGCGTTARSYADPVAGVWEFRIEGRRTSPSLDNPYRLTAKLEGVTVTPETTTIESASVHQPVAGAFTATNTWGTVEATPVEGQVGRVRDLWADVAEGQMTQGGVDVSRDATRLELTITPRQDDADLDVYLFNRFGLAASATSMGPGSERIVLRNPEPGSYAIVVAGVDVPSGTTEFDYHERAYSRGIGSINITSGAAKTLQPGATLAVAAEVTAYAEPLNDRPLVGRVQFANPQGAVIGAAEVLINEVTTPDAGVLAEAPAMVGYDLNNAGVMTGDKQIDSRTMPVHWTKDGGVEELAVREGAWSGYSYDINEHGDSVGQINLDDGTAVAALWRADGSLVELGVPDWMPYDYARAFAINDHGVVVGNASLFRMEDDGYYHEYNDPFVWTEAKGFRRLPHIGDDRHNTEPYAVNNDGYVVGQSHIGWEQHAVMWSPDGTIEDLGTLPGQSDAWARSINESGVVVGSSGDDAFVWARADGMRRLADFGFDGAATKVTNDGWVMGSAQITPWDETPVVWDPQGRIYDVYGMVDPAWFFPVQGMGLNDQHQLLVYGYTDDGNSGLKLLQLPELP
jgi:probable HAF family extracellular repeat protein